MGRMFNEMYRFEIGQALKEVRKLKRLSAEQVALDNDMSVMRVIQIEAGVSLSIKSYKLLAQYYGKTIKIVLIDE